VSAKPRRSIVALIPTKNEAWILDRTLACTSLWADYIIVADQGSDDNTREIAGNYPKVTLLVNPGPTFSESDRQRLLIDAARAIPGEHVLVALDADEILSANVLDDPEWRSAVSAPLGTIITFSKVELHPTPRTYCLSSAEDRDKYLPFGYVDDGANHESQLIHAPRVPTPENAPVIQLRNVTVLHYGLCNMARFQSKDRWYACFNRIQFPHKSIVAIHREADWFDRTKAGFNVRPSSPEWFLGYEQVGIDVCGVEAGWKLTSDTRFWWDWDILRMFEVHGVAPFAMLDIWTVDWEAVRMQGITLGIDGLPPSPIVQPRRITDNLFRHILIFARKTSVRRYVDGAMRRVEKILYI